jgi:anti-anti-sigma factor
MAISGQGRALYAEHEGTYVLKLLGDVRIPLCPAIDAFIEDMFNDVRLQQVLIDLADTDLIDSTALGLLAKIAVRFRRRFQQKPVILSLNPDINRILDSMGFEKVFSIVDNKAEVHSDLTELPDQECSDQCVCEKVLEAHRILMDLNEANHNEFRDLVATLEAECGQLSQPTDSPICVGKQASSASSRNGSPLH